MILQCILRLVPIQDEGDGEEIASMWGLPARIEFYGIFG